MMKQYNVEVERVEAMAEEMMKPLDVNNTGLASNQVLVMYNNTVIPACIVAVWLEDNMLEKDTRVILTCADYGIKVYVHNNIQVGGIVYTISHD